MATSSHLRTLDVIRISSLLEVPSGVLEAQY